MTTPVNQTTPLTFSGWRRPTAVTAVLATALGGSTVAGGQTPPAPAVTAESLAFMPQSAAATNPVFPDNRVPASLVVSQVVGAADDIHKDGLLDFDEANNAAQWYYSVANSTEEPTIEGQYRAWGDFFNAMAAHMYFGDLNHNGVPVNPGGPINADPIHVATLVRSNNFYADDSLIDRTDITGTTAAIVDEFDRMAESPEKYNVIQRQDLHDRYVINYGLSWLKNYLPEYLQNPKGAIVVDY
ncbi:MAG: hypothetical protein AB7P76_10215 [Candidatus Melainabacteria bacterium]